MQMRTRLMALASLMIMTASCRSEKPGPFCMSAADGGAAASMWPTLARLGVTCTEDPAARRARYFAKGEVLAEITYGERTTTQVSFENGRPTRTVEETHLDGGIIHYRITKVEGEEQVRESYDNLEPGSPTVEVTTERWDPKARAWQLVGRKRVPAVSEAIGVFPRP
jgi:hypothetical protein